ncbi:site-specific integrase, partial [Streptomyces sp. TRM76130]|nr:site-specific integrase [Streptomyces sp. TRM76130]
MPEPKKVTARGKTRWRAVVDIGPDPVTGKRRQLTVTRDTKTEVENEVSRIRHQRATGTFVAPSKATVAELVALWLASATRDVEVATKRSYEDAMRYVVAHLGEKRV